MAADLGEDNVAIRTALMRSRRRIDISRPPKVRGQPPPSSTLV